MFVLVCINFIGNYVKGRLDVIRKKKINMQGLGFESRPPQKKKKFHNGNWKRIYN